MGSAVGRAAIGTTAAAAAAEHQQRWWRRQRGHLQHALIRTAAAYGAVWAAGSYVVRLRADSPTWAARASTPTASRMTVPSSRTRLQRGVSRRRFHHDCGAAAEAVAAPPSTAAVDGVAARLTVAAAPAAFLDCSSDTLGPETFLYSHPSQRVLLPLVPACVPAQLHPCLLPSCKRKSTCSCAPKCPKRLLGRLQVSAALETAARAATERDEAVRGQHAAEAKAAHLKANLRQQRQLHAGRQQVRRRSLSS